MKPSVTLLSQAGPPASGAAGAWTGGDLLSAGPLGWGADTLHRIQGWLAALPGSAWRPLSGALAQRGVGPWETAGFVAVAALFVLFHVLWHRRTLRLEQVEETRLEPVLGARGARFAAALAAVALSCLAPLVLWSSLSLARWLLAGPHPFLDLAAALARVYLMSAFVLLGFHEALGRRVLNVRTSEVGRVAVGVWVLVVYVVVLRLLALAVGGLGGPADVLAFLGFLLHAGLILGLGALLFQRRVVLANLPVIQNRLYLGFLKVLHRSYYIVLVYSLGLAVLWLVGYTGVARTLLLRSWSVVGVFIAILYLDQILRRAVRRIYEGPPGAEPPEGAPELASTTILILRYVEVIAGSVLILGLAGLLNLAVGSLSAPLFSVQDRQVSALLVVQVVGILLAFFLISRFLERLLEFKVYPHFPLEPGVGTAISTAVKYVLIFVGLVAAFETAGFDLTVLTVFAGALGIGAGFGLQRFASNIASGMTIIFGRVVRRGDIVTVSDQIGVIREVGIRATVLRSLDNVEYLVPNEKFINDLIINWTYTDPLVRVHLPIGVSYGSDPEQVRQTLVEIARAHKDVRRVPPPTVWFTGFGSSSLDFELLVWMDIKKTSRGQLASDLLFSIFERFKALGIEIPFPQRDLHIRSGWERPGPASSGGPVPAREDGERAASPPGGGPET